MRSVARARQRVAAMTYLPEVTQPDRDAAEALHRELNPDATWDNDERELRIERERIAIGEADDHPFVQAFARHRLAALREREGAAS